MRTLKQLNRGVERADCCFRHRLCSGVILHERKDGRNLPAACPRQRAAGSWTSSATKAASSPVLSRRACTAVVSSDWFNPPNGASTESQQPYAEVGPRATVTD